MPNATAAAISATDVACPTAIGINALTARARSRKCRPQPAASIQPVAGFSP
jgi:hypothetical protein